MVTADVDDVIPVVIRNGLCESERNQRTVATKLAIAEVVVPRPSPKFTGELNRAWCRVDCQIFENSAKNASRSPVTHAAPRFASHASNARLCALHSALLALPVSAPRPIDSR